MRTIFAVASGLLGSLSPLFAQAPPNVLLVVADDVGIDGFGCYAIGTAPPQTPNIDALAARGVRFTNAHACPTCSPTRASVLTGRHGFRTGVGMALGGTEAGLDASEVLLPELVAPAGVATALIGKWHLGVDLGAATPTAEGFGEFTGALQGAVANYYQWPKVVNAQTTISTTYSTTDLVDEALAFVARTPGPWCLVLSFHAAHTPIHTPPANLHTQNLAGLDPAVTPIPFFKAMVEAMDSELGRLFGGIPAATLANTNVVLLGDNGTSGQVVEPPFTPNHAKGTIYQGGVKVPLVIAGPAVGGVPRVEPALVHAVDLLPTLAAMQGVDARAAVPANVPLDGIALQPLLQAPGQTVRDHVYSQQFAGATAMTLTGDVEMIRDARYEVLRFVTANGTREEMYDLQSDPWETSDLLQQPLGVAEQDAYRELWLALAALRGYPAALVLGTGCTGGGATPVLRAIRDPVIGTTFTMRVTGLSGAATAVVGAIGFGSTTWLGVPLPWDLGMHGMPGCSLWIEAAITRFLVAGPQAATWSEVLPNDPGLAGLPFFTQAFVLVPGANAAGALSTRALANLVGG